MRRALLAAWAVVLPALPLGASARAADDGGTRSVLASGAGLRALALGSAFAAIADDASASLWNPAGLGRVERGELEFGQTQYQLDAAETFAAAVYPDWRWGAAAVTVRHFGVSGIEGRDDRNAVTDPSLGSSESEIGFAYGRALAPGWSLGGALKVRRQEIAGRSGSGVGADLGVRVEPGSALGFGAPWARGLAMGLALQNVVEPQVRLDQESVADPSSMRLGFSIAPVFGGGLSVLASLDVEKARGVSPRVHAGLELEPHPLLALRAGIDHGALTAGTGFRWRDAEIAYAFEDQATGATHRAGLTLRFGVAAPEARERAARAEEERLAARIAENERRRDAERIAALLARAEEARRQGDLDQALSWVATARVVDDASAPARALEAALLADRGRALESAGDPAEAAVAFQQALALAPGDTTIANALARSRAASDSRARRSQEIRARFAGALEAFGAGRLAEARRGFAAVLEADPADAEARAMLERVESAIAARAQDLLRRFNLLVQAGQLETAAALLEQVRDLDPRASGLATAGAALERARAEAAKPAAPRVSTPRADEREIATLYRRGVAAFEAGRSDEALRYWELVWSMRPGYQRVDEYLKREYHTRGMEHFAAGRLVEALAMWERALQIDPKDPRTLAYLARAHEQLDRARQIKGDRP